MRKVALFLSAIFLTVMIVSFTSNSSNESGSSIDEVKSKHLLVTPS